MTRYESYSPTGVKRLGDIPSHWKIRKLRRILRPFSQKNHPELPLLSVVREKGVIVRNVGDSEENHNYIPDDLSGYKVVNKGQFAMNKMKAWQGSYGISDHTGIVSPAYFVFDVDFDNLRYFHLAIRSKAYVPFFAQASDGIRVGQWDLDMDRMKETPFIIPPRSEQDQIVRYLDWQVSKINKLIAAKKKEIALIEEHLSSAINKAVTRGLNEHIELKASEISWLGAIPSTWSTIKIKWLFTETNERNNDGTAELLTFSRKKGLIPFSETSDKAPSASDLTNYRLVMPGLLLENRMQAWSGMFICVDKNGCVSPDYSVFNPSQDRYVNVKFYEYVFRNPLQVEQFANASRGMGTGFNRLYTPAFGSIYTVYPPAEEQDEIVEYIDEVKAKHNEAVSYLDRQIGYLQELKNKLISDVVTGQIDVRGIKVPDFEYMESIEDTSEEDEVLDEEFCDEENE